MGEQLFDDLARGLNDSAISRRRALKVVGAAALGAVLSVFLPVEDAEAQRRRSFRQR
jgi:hypothetical protein